MNTRKVPTVNAERKMMGGKASKTRRLWKPSTVLWKIGPAVAQQQPRDQIKKRKGDTFKVGLVTICGYNGRGKEGKVIQKLRPPNIETEGVNQKIEKNQTNIFGPIKRRKKRREIL